MAGFWDSCISRFEQELPVQQFNTWIKALRLEDGEESDQGLKLVAPNRFVLQWVRERYLRRLEDMAKQFFAEPVQISINLPEPAELERLDATLLTAKRNNDATESSIGSVTALSPAYTEAAYEKTRLNSTFTFDTLVTGRANDLARAAAYQVALNPGTSYNPLFVYGGVGLGKTHLIHALGNEVYRHNPDKVIRYVHAEDYYADVVRAYQQKSFDVFKRYYRSLDLLLIDDIQFFNNKNRTQEEFFYQLPFHLMDRFWYGFENGYSPSEVAAVMGETPERVEALFRNFERKRNTTEYLRMPPIRDYYQG